MITQEQLDNWFAYHPPSSDEVRRSYERLREAGRIFAMIIVEETPTSADQSAAIRHIREAVMTANAAIACGGR